MKRRRNDYVLNFKSGIFVNSEDSYIVDEETGDVITTTTGICSLGAGSICRWCHPDEFKRIRDLYLQWINR